MSEHKRKREAPKTCWSLIMLLIGLGLAYLLRKLHVFPDNEVVSALPAVLFLLAGNIMDIAFERKGKI